MIPYRYFNSTDGKRALLVPITLVVNLVTTSLFAQSIINTSAISHDLDSTLSVVVEAGGDFSFGNSNVQDLNLHFGVGKSLTEDASIWIVGGGNRLASQRDIIQSLGYIHTRLNYEIRDRLTLNGYLQVQSNSVLEIKSRRLLGVNLDFDFTTDKTLTAALGAFAEWESYTQDVPKKTMRGNFIGIGEYTWGTNEIVGFMYFQPSFHQWRDYRCIGELSIRKQISQYLQLTVNGVVRYDSFPHQSLAPLDLGVTTALRYEFHKK